MSVRKQSTDGNNRVQ
jgi:hypothetical protein